MWLNSIYYAAVHAHSKWKLDEFDKSLNKLEQNNAKNDMKDTIEMFTGIEGLIKLEEGKDILFKVLEDYRAEYKYVCEVYELINTYKIFSEAGQIGGAMEKAKKIYKMITEFKLINPELDGERKEPSPSSRKDLLKDLEEPYIEEDFIELMKQITSESQKKQILDFISQPQPYKNAGPKLFDDLESQVFQKLKSTYEETKSQDKPQRNSLKILTVPINRLKKSMNYTPQLFLEDFIHRQHLFEDRAAGRYLKSASSVNFRAGETPLFSNEKLFSTPNNNYKHRSTVDTAELLRGINKNKSQNKSQNQNSPSPTDRKESMFL